MSLSVSFPRANHVAAGLHDMARTETVLVEQIIRIANNSRFLILPWVRIPHLASRVLAQSLRRLRGG